MKTCLGGCCPFKTIMCQENSGCRGCGIFFDHLENLNDTCLYSGPCIRYPGKKDGCLLCPMSKDEEEDFY